MRLPALLLLTACGGACPEVVPDVVGGTAEQRSAARAALDTLFGQVVPDARCVTQVGITDAPILGGWAGQFRWVDKAVLLDGTETLDTLETTARHEVCHAIDLAAGVVDAVHAEGLGFPPVPVGAHPIRTPSESWAIQCTDGFDALRWRIATERACGDAASVAGLARAADLVSTVPPLGALEVTDERTVVAPPDTWIGWPAVFHGHTVWMRLHDEHEGRPRLRSLVVPIDGGPALVLDIAPPDDPSIAPYEPIAPELLPRGLWVDDLLTTSEGLLFLAFPLEAEVVTTQPVVPWRDTPTVGLHRDGRTWVLPRCTAWDASPTLRLDLDADGRPWVFETHGDSATFYRPMVP